MDFKIYDHLPQCASKLRVEVFIDEQGFDVELDEIDDIATHIVMFDGDKAIGTCRIFCKDDAKTCIVGRLAISKEYRSRGLGLKLIGVAEKEAVKRGAEYMKLHAQCRAKGFYEKAGYVQYGEIEYEENCPHIWMKKKIG